MNGSAVKYWLALAAMLATAYGMSTIYRHQKDQAESPGHGVAEPTSRRPEIILKPFELTDQQGKPFSTASLEGKPWVASFFFTNCPAVCTQLNRTLAQVQADLPDSKVHFVSITCDPDNDTPEALAKYAAHFKADPARWKFLTGDINLIRRIGNDFFKVAVENQTHSDRAFVVDRNGQVRGRFRLTEIKFKGDKRPFHRRQPQDITIGVNDPPLPTQAHRGISAGGGVGGEAKRPGNHGRRPAASQPFVYRLLLGGPGANQQMDADLTIGAGMLHKP